MGGDYSSNGSTCRPLETLFLFEESGQDSNTENNSRGGGGGLFVFRSCGGISRTGTTISVGFRPRFLSKHFAIRISRYQRYKVCVLRQFQELIAMCSPLLSILTRTFEPGGFPLRASDIFLVRPNLFLSNEPTRL